MTAATRLVHALAGTPEPIASQAAHLTGPGGTCCICGEHADRLAPAARTLGASFTDRAMFRDPTADGVCPACLWCASGKPPATVRMWTVIAAPGVDLGPSQPKAWIQDTPGLLLTSRADTAPLARILGDPPPGPWTVSVALSGQKHVLPYADVNHGAGRWTIRVETADVTATPDQWRLVHGHALALRRLDVRAEDIAAGTPGRHRTRDSLDEWSRLSAPLRPWTGSALLDLALWTITRKDLA